MDKSIELVIFDMDGLMIDTESITKKCLAKALNDIGHELPDELFNKLLGRDANADRHYLTTHYGKDFDFDKTINKTLDYRDEHIKKYGIQMKKGLLHILDALDEINMKKCIATSSIRTMMEKKLSGLNLLHRFDGFITGDQVSVSKPEPEIFLNIAKTMKVLPANCIVLEDSNAGIAAAYSAGMRAIMIPDLAQPDEETLPKIFAKCNDLEEAAKIIINIAKSS